MKKLNMSKIIFYLFLPNIFLIIGWSFSENKDLFSFFIWPALFVVVFVFLGGFIIGIIMLSQRFK